jgi:Asp-tRNA(Asn)/Glu-tRNA(Gln) amidotransferase A subunit family amidase
MASGSDGAGSIRIPASMCGLVGLKPSRGRVSMAPSASDLTLLESVRGVISRTVRDMAVMLDSISGSDVGEFMQAALPRRPYAAELDDPQTYRIAVSVEPWGPYAAPRHIIGEVEKTAGFLEDLGHKVVHHTPPIDFEAFYKAFTLHWIGGWLPLGDMAHEKGVELSSDLVEDLLFRHVVRAREITLAEWFHKDEVLMQVTRKLDAFFRQNHYDLILTPTVAVDTPPVGSIYRLQNEKIDLDEWLFALWGATPYTPLCNGTGVPAISVPLGSEGQDLPLGMHFFGQWGSEDKLINLAAQLEKAYPWTDRIPPIHVSQLVSDPLH